MSRTALVVLGIIVLTLGAIFLILQTTPSQSPGAAQPTPVSPLPGTDLADVSAIHLTLPGADTLTIRRQGPLWMLHTGDLAWPVAEPPVHTILRALQTATPTPPDAAPSSITNPIVLAIDHGAQSTTIRLSATPLAGRVVLESSNGFAGSASPAVLEDLTDPGPRAWRLTTPFPNFPPPTATRLTIGAHDDTIQLARIDNRWRVLRPIAARANPIVVEDALTRLGGYRIRRFIESDLDLPTTTGLRPPVLTLTIDRTPSAPRALHLGNPLPTGATHFAGVDEPAPATFEVSGPPPTSFSTAVRSYLATTATDVAPADVGAIRLRWKDGTVRLIERELDRWVDRTAGAPADAEPIDHALRFLADEPAEPQESFSEQDIRSLLRVELLDFAGDPLDVLGVGYNADGSLTVRGQNVIWLYAHDRGPTLLSLPDFSDLPPESPTTPSPEHEGDYPTK